MALLPFVVATIYLQLSRSYFDVNLPVFESLDYVFWGLSVAAGAASVWLIPVGRLLRSLALVVYVPLFLILVAFYALSYVCGVFEACF